MSDSLPPESELTQHIVALAGEASSPLSPPADAAEGDQKAASGSTPPVSDSEAKVDPAPVEKEETQEDIR